MFVLKYKRSQNVSQDSLNSQDFFFLKFKGR